MAGGQEPARGDPRWNTVLRALREARGLTQDGWGLALGVGRATVQRWERGTAVPNDETERSIVELCRDRGLFRFYRSGPLQGFDLTQDRLQLLLEEARLGLAAGTLGDNAGGDAADGATSKILHGPGDALGGLALSTLPAGLNSFEGREQELDEVERLLGQSRLLTLTGPGGSGKTRLALEAAARSPIPAADRYFVDLAAITEPELLVTAIAGTLKILGAGEQPAADVLKVMLAAKRLLLILDNFEHLAGAAPRVSDLLAVCPRLTVLVTSREPLHLRGEQELAVPPLPTPDPARAQRVDELRGYPSVALFMARARAVQPNIAFEDADVRAVAAICRKLDGLPLAIELAAARSKMLTPTALLARLDRPLSALGAGGGDRPLRQRTLGNTLDWSFELLAPLERMLFARLAVFTGGFGLEPAETVCSGGEIASTAVMDLLSQLVDKSLVVAERGDGPVRYRLLETIREYALDKLRSSGELTATSGRLLAWCLGLAERPVLATGTPAEYREWLQQLDREHDCVRAALAWSLNDGGRPADGLRLAAALGPFWNARGYVVEGLSWLKQLLNAAGAAPAPLRADALQQAGMLVWETSDLARAAAWLEESLEIHRALDEKARCATTLIALGRLAIIRGDLSAGVSRFEMSLRLYRQLGDRRGIADALSRIGMASLLRGDVARADALGEESLMLYRELGDARGTVTALCVLARSAASRGAYPRAVELNDEAGRLARAERMERELADILIDAGQLANLMGDPERAGTFQRESLALYSKLGLTIGIVTSMTALAGTLLGTGQAARATMIYGAAEALRETIGTELFPVYRRACEQLIESAREALGTEEFAAALIAGRDQPLDAAVAAALAPPA